MLRIFNWALKFLKLKVINPSIRLPTEDMGKDFYIIHEKVKDFSMTSPERLYATYQAINFVEDNKIEGAVVECGVWRGGNTMVMAETLMLKKSINREIYLYDTFEGMTAPTDKDVSVNGRESISIWKKWNKTDHNEWCYAPLDEVKRNMATTAYPADKIHYVKGMVENTIPATLPNKIAVLRLDTDWYASTKHELIHLFPNLSENAILLLDDYGYWKGQKEAVDEYFESIGRKILLHRVDHSGRMMVKAF